MTRLQKYFYWIRLYLLFVTTSAAGNFTACYNFRSTVHPLTITSLFTVTFSNQLPFLHFLNDNLEASFFQVFLIRLCKLLEFEERTKYVRSFLPSSYCSLATVRKSYFGLILLKTKTSWTSRVQELWFLEFRAYKFPLQLLKDFSRKVIIIPFSFLMI